MRQQKQKPIVHNEELQFWEENFRRRKLLHPDCVQKQIYSQFPIKMLRGDDSWHVRFATWAAAPTLADLFIILLLFSSCLSLLDSRSETELQLWSLQRHTQLGGSVSRTSAGLQAPKQVSPALVCSSPPLFSSPRAQPSCTFTLRVAFSHH